MAGDFIPHQDGAFLEWVKNPNRGKVDVLTKKEKEIMERGQSRLTTVTRSALLPPSRDTMPSKYTAE